MGMDWLGSMACNIIDRPGCIRLMLIKKLLKGRRIAGLFICDVLYNMLKSHAASIPPATGPTTGTQA
jgi:hypothetical protein